MLGERIHRLKKAEATAKLGEEMRRLEMAEFHDLTGDDRTAQLKAMADREKSEQQLAEELEEEVARIAAPDSCSSVSSPMLSALSSPTYSSASGSPQRRAPSVEFHRIIGSAFMERTSGRRASSPKRESLWREHLAKEDEKRRKEQETPCKRKNSSPELGTTQFQSFVPPLSMMRHSSAPNVTTAPLG